MGEKTAARALRASEERLRAIFSQSVLGIGVTRLDGHFEEANEQLCTMLGYSEEELRALTVAQVTHPDDVATTQEQIRRLIDGVAQSYKLEKRYLSKDGRVVWANTAVTLLRHADVASSQFIGIIEDITDRRQAEEARSRLAAVVEHSGDAIVTKTLDGIITSWNPGAERIFGYAAAEVIGRSVTLLIPPDQGNEEPAILERIRRGERIDHYTTVRRRKDGTLIDVSLSVSPLKDADGRIIGASKIARDITEQTRMLGLLERTGKAIVSQLDLQIILQTVTDTATELTGARFGAFFYNVVDASGEAYLLYTLSGAPREAFEKLGLPRNTPVFKTTFAGEGVLRSGDITQDWRYGTMAPHHGMPKGHLPVRSYLAVPVISRTGTVLGGLFFGHPEPDVFTEHAEQVVKGLAAHAAIAMDNAELYAAAQREIGQRQKVESALRETDRRKDEFLATLAHELRNPLAPIRQAAVISSSPSATDAQKRWSHDVISRQVQHMSLLLDDLLDISRVTRGTLELRMEMTELSAVIEAAVETARPVIDAKHHGFSTHIPTEPVTFAADPLRLAQVLSNLLTNAAKYTDPGGSIGLVAQADADTITISVTDTGIGLERETIPRVFTMFSQIQSTRDRSEGGLGIGLALSKGLVELHEGTIEARSAGAGKGSEFRIRLPRRPFRKGVPPAPLPVTKKPSTMRRVLIADDNRDAAESLAILLRLEGHDVTVVNNGREALSAFQAVVPEVVLLDIGMPELDGYEVARLIRQRAAGGDALLIAVTGWGQESDKARAVAAGFNHHFTKPVEPARIFDLLR